MGIGAPAWHSHLGASGLHSRLPKRPKAAHSWRTLRTARNYLVLANIVATRILSRSVIAELVKDGRAADDIYPTYDRAQDAHALRTLGESLILESQSVRFLTSPKNLQPFLRASGALRTASHACHYDVRPGWVWHDHDDGFSENARTAYAA